MILGIEKELSVFIQAALAGNLVYLAYCAIRVFRRIVQHNLFWVSVEDALFWIVTGFYMFARIYKTSNGTIRWYFVVGVLLGGIVTHRMIKKITKKYIDKTKKRE